MGPAGNLRFQDQSSISQTSAQIACRAPGSCVVRPWLLNRQRSLTARRTVFTNRRPTAWAHRAIGPLLTTGRAPPGRTRLWPAAPITLPTERWRRQRGFTTAYGLHAPRTLQYTETIPSQLASGFASNDDHCDAAIARRLNQRRQPVVAVDQGISLNLQRFYALRNIGQGLRRVADSCHDLCDRARIGR